MATDRTAQAHARSKPRVGRDDVAFASYLSTLAIALIAGMIFVITLDIEGETKAAATVALLLPGLAMAAVALYAVVNPLGRSNAAQDQPMVSAAISPSRKRNS